VTLIFKKFFSIKGGAMKKIYCFGIAVFFFFGLILCPDYLGQPDSFIKEAYKQILAEADKNKDGKLQVSECQAIFKDKKKGAADCGFWDANHDGVITEEEYVSQVKSLRKKK
jgi:hypothetical protein